MIEEYFEQLGFTRNESSIFLALAEVGKSTASLLAKRVGIPRTTAYSVLESLVQKGVVSLEQKGSSTFYSCNKPVSLLRMIEEEQERVAEQVHVARQLVEMVGPYFKSRHFSIPKIQFFEGRQNVNNMLYDFSDAWRESVSAVDYTWWGYQDHTFVEKYLPWLEHIWSTAPSQEMVKLLSNESQIEVDVKDKFPRRRQVKPVPEPFHFSSTIWILGEYILLIMTRQKPEYAFQMKDPVFAENLRTLFKMLWGLTSEKSI